MGLGKLVKGILVGTIVLGSTVGFSQDRTISPLNETITTIQEINGTPKEAESITPLADVEYSTEKDYFITPEMIKIVGESYSLYNALNSTHKTSFFWYKNKISKGKKTGDPLGDMMLFLEKKTNVYDFRQMSELAYEYDKNNDEIKEAIGIYALAVMDGKPRFGITEKGEKFLVESGAKEFIDENWNSLFSFNDKVYFFDEIKKGKLYVTEIVNFLWLNNFYGKYILDKVEPDQREAASFTFATYAHWKLFEELPEEDKILDYSLLHNYNM